MIQKYLRSAKSPLDKEKHISGLREILSTPQWQEVLVEVEDLLIKEYMMFEKCETEKQFMQVRANVYAVKKIAGLNNLADVVTRRRMKL